MVENEYTIGIGCIGSGVGQSIVTSCRASKLAVRTVGFGNTPYAYGAYDCDKTDYLPSIYEPDYIEKLIQKYHQYRLDLFIPSLDNEVLLLTQNLDELTRTGLNIILPSNRVSELSRNKDQMSDYFPGLKRYFVRNYKRSDLLGKKEAGEVHFPLIAKPRSGFASKGIRVLHCLEDVKSVPEDFIIQELAVPSESDPNHELYCRSIEKGFIPQISEISTQVVVDKEGNVIGKMASYNKLNNGVPIEITIIDDPLIWEPINLIIPELLKLGLRGPINIQGRLTDEGLKIFEMNPRFTGITGLRALMGFNEVEACVKSWLDLEYQSISVNKNKFGVRQTADKAIVLDRKEEVKISSQKLNHLERTEKKTIFITGASGYLGHHLVDILDPNDYQIWLYSRDKERLKSFRKSSSVSCYDKKDYENGNIAFGSIDIIIHLGFSRSLHGFKEVADSLSFTADLFQKAMMAQVPAIINISSQSVYGHEKNTPWIEMMQPAPVTAYAQAKYASELLLSNVKEMWNHIGCTSLRFPSLTGGNGIYDQEELLNKLIDHAYHERRINITDGRQKLERLDVRDAAEAILAIMKKDPMEWRDVYNVGTNTYFVLSEAAEKIADIASHRFGFKPDVMIDKKKSIEMNLFMDSTTFMKDTGWSPQRSLEDSIDSIIDKVIDPYVI